MSWVVTVIAFAGLIVFHEFGHYLLARVAGMRVDEFALGFGYKVASKKVGETEYALRAFPLGGFVRIAGMDPAEEGLENDPRSYSNKNPFQRLAVIVAGPIFNYILAAVLFAMVLMMGQMVPDHTRAAIGEVLPGKPAAAAGFEKGDVVIRIDQDPITDWASFVEAVAARAGQESQFTILRGGEEMTLTVTPDATTVDGKTIGQIGVIVSATREAGWGFVDSVKGGFIYTWNWNVRIIAGLYEIIVGKQEAELQGPVGIIERTSKAAEAGWVELLSLVGIISVHLGLFNLLPIPALDGGRLIFLGWEIVSRRPVNARIEFAVHAIGFLLLLGLMVVVTIGDISRLWGG